MIVFPAIDLIGGKCVRLTEGDFERLTDYQADPVDTAKKYEDAGLSHLHLVDLDGARNKKVTQYKILEKICSKTNLKVDFGGGIKTDDDLRIVFESGAAQANVGSLAVSEPEIFEAWMVEYGSDRIILAADVRDMKVAAHAWKETSPISIFDLLDRFEPRGLIYLTCTDISRDGKLTGVNHELYKTLMEKYPALRVTASGGVHHVKDLQGLLEMQCFGVIVGKAIYENKIRLEELVSFQLN